MKQGKNMKSKLNVLSSSLYCSRRKRVGSGVGRDPGSCGLCFQGELFYSVCTLGFSLTGKGEDHDADIPS